MKKRLVQGPAHPVWIADEATGEAMGDADRPLYVQGAVTFGDDWELAVLEDTDDDDSDKAFTVPVGYEYQILWVYVELTSSGDAGDRLMAVAARTAVGAQVFEVRCGVTQAASLTYHYTFAPSLADLTTVRDTTFVMCPLPPTLFLTALQELRVWDQNAIAAGADDMVVRVGIARRAV